MRLEGTMYDEMKAACSYGVAGMQSFECINGRFTDIFNAQATKGENAREGWEILHSDSVKEKVQLEIFNNDGTSRQFGEFNDFSWQDQVNV